MIFKIFSSLFILLLTTVALGMATVSNDKIQHVLFGIAGVLGAAFIITALALVWTS